MFSLLKFMEPEVPEVVPTSWLHVEKCTMKWPPYDDTRQILKAILNVESAQENWQTYSYEKILFRTDNYNEALQKRKDAEMFSDVENKEEMKKTRSNRHKKHLSDFEIDVVGKNVDVQNEARKKTENLLEEECTSKRMLTEMQEESSEHVNKKSTRKRTYDAEYNGTDFLISNTNINNTKSKSDTVELVSIKKRVDIPYTEDIFVRAPINSRKERGNKGIVTASPDQNCKNVNNKSIRAHSYDAGYNGNDYLISIANSMTAKSDTVEEVSIQKGVDILYSEDTVVPLEIHRSNEDQNSESNEALRFNAAQDVDMSNPSMDILKIILTKQNKLLLQNNIILNKLSAIENKQVISEISELPANITEELSTLFIIKTVKDLESFDSRLKKKKYFNYVVQFLKQKGSINARTHVFNILNSTISNSVACKYSYKGQKKKNKFMDLIFNTCIFKAVQLYNTSTTEDQVKSAIASWLDNSSSRLKTEQKKCNQSAQLNTHFEDSDDD